MTLLAASNGVPPGRGLCSCRHAPGLGVLIRAMMDSSTCRICIAGDHLHRTTTHQVHHDTAASELATLHCLHFLPTAASWKHKTIAALGHVFAAATVPWQTSPPLNSLVLEDVEADAAELVHIGVVDLRQVAHLLQRSLAGAAEGKPV